MSNIPAFAVPSTVGDAGAGQSVGTGAAWNRTFMLGAGAVTGDQVSIEGSTDNGSSYRQIIDRGTGSAVVLTPGKPEAVVNDGCDSYRMRRQAKGSGSTLTQVTLEVQPNEEAGAEPIRHQLPATITASFTAPRPIASMFEARVITGGVYIPDTTVAADASNFFVLTVKEYDADGAAVRDIATLSTAGGVTANKRSSFTMAVSEPEIPVGHSLAWIATETGTATLGIGLFELAYR